jgi:hypothetical protein
VSIVQVVGSLNFVGLCCDIVVPFFSARPFSSTLCVTLPLSREPTGVLTQTSVELYVNKGRMLCLGCRY